MDLLFQGVDLGEMGEIIATPGFFLSLVDGHLHSPLSVCLSLINPLCTYSTLSFLHQYNMFVCVEAGAVAAPVSLASGLVWHAAQELAVVRS